MAFLATTCFLMYANFFAAIRFVVRGNDRKLMFLGHMAACLPGAIGFLLGTELLIPRGRAGIAGDAYNWTPVAYLIFGVISAALFGVKLYEKARAPKTSGIGILFGLTVWAVIGSAYVAYAAVDHLVFFRDSERSGQMDVAFSKEPLNCSGGVLLVRVDESTAEYRCPTSIRLGADYRAPFVPWPSYVRGESAALKGRIDEVLHEAAETSNLIVVPAGELSVLPPSLKSGE